MLCRDAETLILVLPMMTQTAYFIPNLFSQPEVGQCTALAVLVLFRLNDVGQLCFSPLGKRSHQPLLQKPLIASAQHITLWASSPCWAMRHWDQLCSSQKTHSHSKNSLSVPCYHTRCSRRELKEVFHHRTAMDCATQICSRVKLGRQRGQFCSCILLALLGSQH